MSQIDRFFGEHEPDEVDLEIQQAQLERATFTERLNAYASSGVLIGKAPLDGVPLNDGAAAEYLAGRDLGGEGSRTGTGVPMRDPEPDHDRNGNLVTDATLQPTYTFTRGGGSSSKRRERTPNALERHEAQERRMRSLQQRSSSDAERASQAIANHQPTAAGRPLTGHGPRIHPGRVDSGLIVGLHQAGAGANVEEHLHLLQHMIETGQTYAQVIASRRGASQ